MFSGCSSALFELAPHRGEEVVSPEWLGQKRHMRGNQLHVHELSREAAHEDDGQSGVKTGQGGRELPSIHHRHPQVGQYEADLLVGPVSEKLQRTCAIGSLEDGIPLILQQATYDAPQAVLILYHQYGVSGIAYWAPGVHAG
jgi:hypothetical protein